MADPDQRAANRSMQSAARRKLAALQKLDETDARRLKASDLKDARGKQLGQQAVAALDKKWTERIARSTRRSAPTTAKKYGTSVKDF